MPSLKLKPKPSPNPIHEWSFEAIGTHWWIGIYTDQSQDRLQQLQRIIADTIEAYDRTYSRFRPDSLVTSISKQAGKYGFPPDAAKLFKLYRQFYDATEGLVTPLIGQQLSQAGYDANYSLRPSSLNKLPSWDDAMQYNNGVLHTTQPVLLDFGAIGKGYLVDIITDLLITYDVQQFCVDASGDMRSHGLAASLRIGMENPHNPDQVVGVIELNNQSLCASAPNRRQWQGFHHIINPATKSSPDHLSAVWAVSENCAIADGLTTALFFAKPALLAKHFNFEYALLYADNSITVSPGLPAELFTEKEAHA